jgi:hypothetical protein
VPAEHEPGNEHQHSVELAEGIHKTSQKCHKRPKKEGVPR